MSRLHVLSNYKESLAKFLDIENEQVFLFWKGRVAFYAILKAIGIKPGDEVIMPAFTCVVVPNACIYLGAIPVYVDIDPETFTVNYEQVEEKITTRTKVILAQNTFGLSPDMDRLMELANRYKIRVIEDCAHGFGGTYKGRKNGTIADASFYSSQWNKPFSTGIGGMTVIHDRSLISKMKEIELAARIPSFFEETLLRMQLMIRSSSWLQRFYWVQIKVYRFLTSKNIIPGSSSGEELEKPSMPADFLKGMSKTQATKGVTEIGRIVENLSHRKVIASNYIQFLRSLDLYVPFEPEYANHTFIKFPLLVKDRNAFMSAAKRSGVELGDWFLSPIHPILKNMEWWHYSNGNFPIAEKICGLIVNLPTHAGIQDDTLEKIKKFLLDHKHMIIQKI